LLEEAPMKPGSRAWFAEVEERYGPDLLKLPGYNKCIIGVVTQFDNTVILYDREKVIAKLVREFTDPGSALLSDDVLANARSEAESWFEFNMVGAWMGRHTPAFSSPI